MEVVAASPICGQGFAVTSRLIGASNTHSSLLAVFTGTGALGLIIVTCGLARLSKELWSSIRIHQPGAVGCAAALVAGLVNCVTVPVLGEHWRPESTVFVCFLALHLFYVRRASSITFPHVPCSFGNSRDRLSCGFAWQCRHPACPTVKEHKKPHCGFVPLGSW